MQAVSLLSSRQFWPFFFFLSSGRISDNMPVAWCYQVRDEPKPYCATSFPMGCYVDVKGDQHDACVAYSNMNEKNAVYLFNHIDFVIEYHTPDKSSPNRRIVAINVTPRSIKHPEKGVKCQAESPPLKLVTGKDMPDQRIKYTYSVQFKV